MKLMTNLKSIFFALSLGLFFEACSMTPAPEKPLSCEEKKQLAKDYWGFSLAEDETPGFKEDILPILASTRDGKIYKCTVCHAKYNELEVTKEQFGDILTSIGPNGSMPKNGDKVSLAETKLMLAWQRAGFPETRQVVKPTTKPTVTSTGGDKKTPANDSGKKPTTKAPKRSERDSSSTDYEYVCEN